MNLGQLNEARKLKAKLDQAKKELSKITVDAEIGRNAIKVTANGQQQIISIKISPEMIDPNKPEYLEKMLVKVLNEALEKSQKAAAKSLQSLTAGLKLPGM